MSHELLLMRMLRLPWVQNGLWVPVSMVSIHGCPRDSILEMYLHNNPITGPGLRVCDPRNPESLMIILMLIYFWAQVTFHTSIFSRLCHLSLPRAPTPTPQTSWYNNIYTISHYMVSFSEQQAYRRQRPSYYGAGKWLALEKYLWTKIYNLYFDIHSLLQIINEYIKLRSEHSNISNPFLEWAKTSSMRISKWPI